MYKDEEEMMILVNLGLPRISIDCTKKGLINLAKQKLSGLWSAEQKGRQNTAAFRHEELGGLVRVALKYDKVSAKMI